MKKRTGPDPPKRPEWHPEDAGDEFASRVQSGVDSPGQASGEPNAPANRRTLKTEEYVNGVLRGDRTVLARAITLIESNAPAHMDQAQEVLKALLPKAGESIRIGITGSPGAGKSTFIETFGCRLTEQGHRTAVLAVDPSSSRTRGSILGDKTRMERLSRDPQAFIRPSPSGGALGGVARKTRETILICEAAGFDVVLVETMGVGQSETAVRSMVDFFLLLTIPGAGDELQGIKRGVMELADALVVNKADGDNLPRAGMARTILEQALHYLQPATTGWRTQAFACSALTGEGIDEIWRVIGKFREITAKNDAFQARRRKQSIEWLYAMLEEQFRSRFLKHPGISRLLPDIEQAVLNDALPVTSAVRKLLAAYDRPMSKNS